MIIGGTIFVIIGTYMMKTGIKKTATSSPARAN